MKFGIHTGLQNTTVDDLRALWRQADGQGFGWISIWDHFYAADATVTAEGTSSGSVCFEAIAAHAALALETTNVRCGSLVYCVGYRHPAVLANAAATLDHLSGGRITMGLGGGWHQGEYAAYGMDFEPVPVRLRRTDEAIQVIRKLLTEDVAEFSGEFYELHEARCDPKPVQARLPLWIGGGGEKVTLRIAAQHADGWNVPFIPPDAYRHKVQVLTDHCERLGRDPSTIEKSVNLTIAWTDDAFRERFGGMADWIRPSALTGSHTEMIDRIAEYADAGADWVILAFRAPFAAEDLDRFVAEVARHFPDVADRSVGIDLGAQALHVVVLDTARTPFAVAETTVVQPQEEHTLRRLCDGADAIAIDAPSDPSPAVHEDDLAINRKFRVARCGEIALGEQHRCWVPFVSPRSHAEAPPWMRVGFDAWRVTRSAGHSPIEVYPSGAFTALAGRRLAKKATALGVRERLEVLGCHLTLPADAAMWSHDAIDATIAALVAAWSATNGPVVAARHDHADEDGSAIWIPVSA